MPEVFMPLKTLLAHTHALAESALPLWDLPRNARVRLINVSENVTYQVEAPCGHKSVLRVHREGYHSRHAIACELAWLDALRAEGTVATPEYYTGRNGDAIQSAGVDGLTEPRLLVLFHFIEGVSPEETTDMVKAFHELGTIAAHCHEHVLHWQKPDGFERLTWDFDAVFGQTPTWGNWRDAPNVTAEARPILERVEATIGERLLAFGKPVERYNLIHADMRLANLLTGPNGTRLIDFDDCGFGWFMYDFAAAISFIEDDPRIPALKASWLEGYRAVRDLPREDEAEIDTFIMLRRMALLAWIGSHIEAPEPQALAPGFAETTARLGHQWLGNLKPAK